MPETASILKTLLSFSCLAGLGMLLMALGVVPVDPGMDAVAQIFIGPFGIPFRLFAGILGPSKILGVLSLWGYGPLPKTLGMAGLAAAALCGSIGHFTVGETGPGIAAASYVGMMGALFMIEEKKGEVKKE